jgi:hypothetical protein
MPGAGTDGQRDPILILQLKGLGDADAEWRKDTILRCRRTEGTDLTGGRRRMPAY